LVDGDRVPLRVEPLAEALEERLAGEEHHLRFVEVSDQRRVEETLVVRCDEHRAGEDQVFRADHAQSEDGAIGRAEGHPAEPVDPAHRSRRFLVGQEGCLLGQGKALLAENVYRRVNHTLDGES